MSNFKLCGLMVLAASCGSSGEELSVDNPQLTKETECATFPLEYSEDSLGAAYCWGRGEHALSCVQDPNWNMVTCTRLTGDTYTVEWFYDSTGVIYVNSLIKSEVTLDSGGKFSFTPLRTPFEVSTCAVVNNLATFCNE